MPTTSRTLVTNCGSVDNFQVSTMCSLRPNARQIRETADCDMPSASAIERVDQCVSPVGGVWPRVLATSASTCSSVILRGAPERGRSTRPSSRSATNRDRHLRTVSRETPRSSATRAFDRPSAHASTIRDRSTSA